MALVSSNCKRRFCWITSSYPQPLLQSFGGNFVSRTGTVKLIKSISPSLLPRIILVFANVNPFCSKFNASSKGSTITFPLLPTVYHSWIAKANLCCDFSFARSLLSIFKFVSQSNWVPHHKVLAPRCCWNASPKRHLVLQPHRVLWTSREVRGGLCP